MGYTIEQLKKINPSFDDGELKQLIKLMELGVLTIEEFSLK